MSAIVEALNRIQAARERESGAEPPSPPMEIPNLESAPKHSNSHSLECQDFRKADCVVPVAAASPEIVQSSPDAQAPFKGLSVDNWVRIVRQEYVHSYLQDGGSTIKFAIYSDQDTQSSLQSELNALAKADGFVFVKIDARYTKIHLLDRLFFKIAKQLDWDELAYDFLCALLRENGYHVPDRWEDFSLHNLAALNERKEAFLWKDIQTWLEREIEEDHHLCQEFRRAMMSLCAAQLQANEADLHVAQSVKEWLRGELRLISSVKHALIFQKITRHNARHLLTSLTHWLRRIKRRGLLVTLDISRYLVAQKPSEPDTTFYYSPAAVVDLYDMLRQCIDGLENQASCLMVVLAPPEFLHDRRRGVDRYEALKLRIWNDVRDKYQQNPLAPLVCLSASERDCLTKGQVGSFPIPAGPLPHRRVVEGLRAGVPNREVVRALGCYQPEVEGRFQQMITILDQQAAEGQPTRGMIVEGGFGTGKSHVLAYLQDLALQQHCVCSHVVISKETPLYHPVKLYQAAIEQAITSEAAGEVVGEIANRLDVWSPEYQALSDWVHDYRNGLDQRFAATMFLFQRMSSEPELRHRVIRFWSGEPLAMNEIRACLRQCGVYQRYSFARTRETDLARQRFYFAVKLMRLAGYRGWVVFLDEAELIGRYAFSQRLKSYAELARMLGASPDNSIPGLTSVVALTDDFQSEILEGKGDRNRVLDALGTVGTHAKLEKQAEEGIRFIEWDTTPLRELTEVRVEEAYHKVRHIHQQAYGEPSVLQPHELQPGGLTGKRMREWVKGWVTEWDLKRLLAREQVELECTPIKPRYQEDKTLGDSEEEGQSHVDQNQPLHDYQTKPDSSQSSSTNKSNPFARSFSVSST